MNQLPEWITILPPILAILLAFITKEVVSSLLSGLLLGVMIVQYQKDQWLGVLQSPFVLIDTYLPQSVVPNPESGQVDRGHISILIFSVMIGGVSMLVQKNGGMSALVHKLSRFANTKKKSQMLTYLMGILIFFDDYANTLIVGNTTRGLARKFKISKEKMAYLVDSTAAPIAALAFATTWIGAELTYISDSTKGLLDLEKSAYALFLSSIPYSFYAILTLVFIPLIVMKNIDFGPMKRAEDAAQTTESTDSYADNPGKENGPIGLALLPLLILSIGTLIGLLVSGYSENVWQNPELSLTLKLSRTIGESNSYHALLWSSFVASIVGVLTSLWYKKLSLKQSIESLFLGYKSMIEAVIILILAWSLSVVLDDLGTASFLEEIISGHVPPHWLPSVVFVLAILVSFSTGSSWGTMAILFPLILSTAWQLYANANLVNQAESLFSLTIACIMSGAVFGDHISPISDTTIMSSMSTGCNHIEHVRTQMPYAILIGLVGLFAGIVPVSFGLNVWFALILCLLVLLIVVFALSKMQKEV